MELTFNEIINTIGKAIGKNLVVRKTVEAHSTMKIIKTFTGELYEINKSKGELIERFTKTDKVSTASLAAATATSKSAAFFFASANSFSACSAFIPAFVIASL